jgi:hypothetical protein
MNRPYTRTQAANVKAGDTIIFDTPRWDVVVEEARPMIEDGWVMLTANNDTWSLALKTTDTVRVLQGAAEPNLLKALTRLSAAALARDTTMGDQCALFAAQAELRDANKEACEAIAKATA